MGWKGYASWLYVYTAISGSFKEGWIPDNYYGNVVIPRIQGDYGKISFLKPLNNKIFNASISPDIAYFINGRWFDANFKSISSESIKKLVTGQYTNIVYKTDQSFQGRGVFIIHSHNFDVGLLEKKGNGVLQYFIEQHPFFNQFTSKSIATIRITTVVPTNGNPILRACYLRLGRENDSHIKSSSHIRIPIGLQSGALSDIGYMANWKRITVHPDSRMEFSNKTIPNYQNCIEMVLRLHEKMPMVQSIGWDVILDIENRPIIMEWNGYGNDIKFSEATQGPCFQDLKW